jgi:ubiquinol-cytochrome c reductase cytochrome b subunit
MSAIGKVLSWTDARTGAAKPLRIAMNKVFPDHWSFMLGEIALYSFIILLLSGTYLTLFFVPSSTEIIYNGSYIPLKGVKMTEAYASALDISFDVRGGLLMRQIHHWAALFFIAAMMIHLLRVFFTGAFRRPREINWVIGLVLLVLGIIEGFAGYTLPDDLLSGTGIRITEGIILATPVLGTWMSSLIFGGEFPGTDFIPRLYMIHILLIPGIMLALITVHMMMVVLTKHTQFAGPGRTQKNVVGFPLMPVYVAKAGGFFFIVFGITTFLAGLVTINPIWLFGPYVPNAVTAGSQPDFYMGFLDGAVRIMPGLESTIFGYILSWNLLVPAMVLPGIVLGVVGAYPWIEAWASGDKKEHHLLDRPRNAPTRTALGVAFMAFYGVLWLSAGNDLIAITFGMSINSITEISRVAVFALPVILFWVTKRIALSLQRRDRDKLLHGRETGQILRLPHGEFLEIHAPISDEEKAVILSKVDIQPLPAPSLVDANGVKRKDAWKLKLQTRVSNFYYGDNIPKPTAQEIEAAEAHMHVGGHGDDHSSPEISTKSEVSTH